MDLTSKLITTPVLKECEIPRPVLEGFKEVTLYEKYRPEYTDKFVSYVIENLYKERYDTDYDILELGAGTGKFTRKILDQFTNMQPCRYLATDPLEHFLAVLKEKTPNVTTNICLASKIPLSSGSVQNVICANSFHWFATEESVKEIARVLVPSGRLILVWLARDVQLEWVTKMEDILTLYFDDETPRQKFGGWKKVFDNCPTFRCLEYVESIEPNVMKGNKNCILNHFMSMSVIVQLDMEEKKTAEQKFRAVLDNYFTDDEDIDLLFKSEYYCTEKI